MMEQVFDFADKWLLTGAEALGSAFTWIAVGQLLFIGANIPLLFFTLRVRPVRTPLQFLLLLFYLFAVVAICVMTMAWFISSMGGT